MSYCARLNIVINQGETFTQQVDVKGQNNELIVGISTAELRGQLRTAYSSATITASFTFTWVDHAAGVATMTMSAATTAAIAAGTYYYDVELYFADGVVWRLFEGKAQVTPEVTR